MKADQNRRVAVLATSGLLFLYFSCCVAAVLHEKLKPTKTIWSSSYEPKAKFRGPVCYLNKGYAKI